MTHAQEVREILERFERGEINTNRFMFEISQVTAKHAVKKMAKNANLGLASRMGHAKKVHRAV